MPGSTSPGAQNPTDANAPTPLGVPKGYAAYVHQPFGQPIAGVPSEFAPFSTPGGGYLTVQPRYFEGHQWSPGSLDAGPMMDLQKKLDAAGFYQGHTYQLGSWGSIDAAAYTELLTQANASGLDETTALAKAMANPLQKAVAARAPFVVTLSSTKDIQDVVKQTGAALYGGQLPDSTVNAIVDAVHASEQAAQQQSYNLAPGGGQMELGQGIGASGQVTSSGLQNLTTDIVTKEHPNEVGATAFANAMDAVMANIRGNVSGYSGLLK